MKFNNVSIVDFAYQAPEIFLSSDELEEKLSPVYNRLKLPTGRLELQTGIKSRGYWGPGTPPSSIAFKAAKKCLNEFDKNNVDLLIHASVCRDFLEPATASVVHSLLDLSPRCQNFDLSNACLGVVDSMLLAGQLIESKQIRSALIVSGENSGPLLKETIHFFNSNEELTRKSIKKYIANLTIGSAGVAILLGDKSLAPDSAKLQGGTSLADTKSSKLCQGDGNVHSLMMETQSEELLKAGVKLAKSNWEQFKDLMKWNSPDKIICHQVGVAHRNLLLETLELPKDKDFLTFPEYGNTGSAALPLTMIKASENNFFNKGDKVALLGIGSGLNSTMLGVQW